MSRRDELIGSIGDLLRLQSGLALVLHQAVAERFGLNPTDLKCLDLAAREEALTAGRIAEVTGMSTSAVTALIDRLEKRGFVERYRDASDRRKVYVRTTGQHEEKLAEIYGPLSDATTRVLESFDVTSLDAVRDVLSKLAEVSRTFIGSEKPENG
ncbi:MarR family transcriptional regulator [Cryptosporangium japonicum]|uniref:MarR family transcriptional regulator n=1 Tax=Cryptosporangium japonicum TaxID=80872 RepID=A0ABN0UCI9_9ACTN